MGLGSETFCNPNNQLYAYPESACAVFEAASSPGTAFDLTQYGVKWFLDVTDYLLIEFSRTISQFYRGIGAVAFITPDPPGFLSLASPPDDSGLGVVQTNVSLRGPGPGLIGFAGVLLLVLSIALSNITTILNIGGYVDSSRQDWFRGLVLIPLWYVLGSVALDIVNLFEEQIFARAFGAFAADTGLDLLRVIIETQSTAQLAANDVFISPILLMIIGAIGALSAVLFISIGIIRYLLILVYFLFGPLLIAMRYSGLPFISEVGRRALWRFPILVFLNFPFGLLIWGLKLLIIDSQLLEVLSAEVASMTSTDPAYVEAYVQMLLFWSIPIIALVVTYRFFRRGAPRVNRSIVLLGETAKSAGGTVTGTSKKYGRKGAKIALADGGGAHPLAHVNDHLVRRGRSILGTPMPTRQPRESEQERPRQSSQSTGQQEQQQQLLTRSQELPPPLWGPSRSSQPSDQASQFDPRSDDLSHVVLQPHAHADADRSSAHPDRATPPMGHGHGHSHDHPLPDQPESTSSRNSTDPPDPATHSQSPTDTTEVEYGHSHAHAHAHGHGYEHESSRVRAQGPTFDAHLESQGRTFLHRDARTTPVSPQNEEHDQEQTVNQDRATGLRHTHDQQTDAMTNRTTPPQTEVEAKTEAEPTTEPDPKTEPDTEVDR